jgi:hypothetical protein
VGTVAGGGTLSLFATQGTYSSDTTSHARWANAALTSSFTGKLKIESGRVDSTFTFSLGNATAVEILSGGQLLSFGGSYPSTLTATISGTGYGEPNFPGALRIAGAVTGTWAGAINLAANATLFAQDASNWTLTGAISGAFQAEFAANNSSNLVVAPSSPNTYGSTLINAGVGQVTAGNANAFSTGVLTMFSGKLLFNGNSFTFASHIGTSGTTIGNGSSSANATITVGGATASTPRSRDRSSTAERRRSASRKSASGLCS